MRRMSEVKWKEKRAKKYQKGQNVPETEEEIKKLNTS